MQLGVFLVLRGVDGLNWYIIRTLISGKYVHCTHARFYKELDREMLNKWRF